MKSKINVKGHSLHIILVGFPIAFFSGAFLFDILGMAFDALTLLDTGIYLSMMGVLFGLLAAIPGFIDYLYTVPPDSTAKKRASQHGLLNLGVILLFGIALVLKTRQAVPFALPMAMEMIGLGMVGIAGWLGGTLVSRNQIGVDIRYANAGKWSEKYLDVVEGKVKVEGYEVLKTDQMMLLHIAKKRIVLAKTEKEYVAFDDRCPHRGGSLTAGAMICGTVQCPWHGSQFDVKSGALKAGPSKEGIHVYPLQVVEGQMFIQVDK